jgi:tetratricopeptide (TPR) repeat protein
VTNLARIPALVPALVFCLALPLCASQRDACPEETPEPTIAAQQLFKQQRWRELVDCFPARPEQPAILDYYQGIALARLERWDEARRALEAGAAKTPGDKRFPLELAGLAFKRGLRPTAREHVRGVLRLDPSDDYANNFLGTLYFLDGNLDAALKYWNRAGRPRIEQVGPSAGLRLDPVLLDRAFAFAPGSILRLSELETSRRRLDLLEVFPVARFELQARSDEQFDLDFRALERNGWGSSRWGVAAGLLRGIPYETIHAEYFNAGGKATNVRSLLRWDSNKRRAFVELSRPLAGEARHRYRVFFDARDEDWSMAQAEGVTSAVPGTLPSTASIALEDFGYQQQEAGFELTSAVSGRFTWSSGASLANRGFQDVGLLPGSLPAGPLTEVPALFADGWRAQAHAAVDFRLWRLPEQRMTLDSSADWNLGKTWANEGSVFSQAGAGLHWRWLPQAQSDDYEMNTRLRAGTTIGDAPFDALYILGLERDNDLPLRGHIGTRDGRKGSAPLGGKYVLLNWETDKTLYRNAFVSISLGPFVDGGSASSVGGLFGSSGWLWDAGVQCKIRSIDGLLVTLVYGRALQSGRNGFYGWSGR